MTLPAPSLDDRRFDDLVDEARRLIPRFCPQWTDHNPSDPGIALLELFAWLTELTIYRLNQVPDRLYVKFLELVGIELYSATPARTLEVFELAAPTTDRILIAAGTQVATEDSVDTPIVFVTERDLTLVRPAMVSCLVRTCEGAFTDAWDDLRIDGRRIACFPTLLPGDALYLGFSACLAGNLIRIDVTTSAEGAGIDPRRPPREWQAWDGKEWIPVRLLSDSSGGFNVSGTVTLLVPDRHEPLPVSATRGWWLRCRLMSHEPDQPTYDISPQLDSITVTGLGGATHAHHAEMAPAEHLGRSTGEPAQEFQVRRAPVLARRPGEHIRVLLPRYDREAPQQWQEWSEVADFAEVGEDERVYTWAGATGEIRFGPQVRGRDGTIIQHGAVPSPDAQIWVTGYRYGGGGRGNVGAYTLTALRSSIPSVERVYNIDPAVGGVDAESIENAKLRGPLELRGGQRAVTPADFERHTLAADRSVARARCIAPQSTGDPIRVLVVPRIHLSPEALELANLGLPKEMEQRIADYLEPRRVLTSRVLVDRPSYLGISVAARVRGATGMRPETVRANAESALYRYINPVVGGPDGSGWPFLRDLNIGEVFGLLASVVGVQGVEDVVLFSADLAKPPGTRRVLETPLGNVVRLVEGTLLASCEHRVLVVE